MLFWNLWVITLSFTGLLPEYVVLNNCEVALRAISGAYEGECRKGLAHGQGKATGTDTYEGAFKRGLPDGQGKYIWANRDVYVGQFKKGKKEGEGTLRKADGTVREGLWKADEYIGEDKTPYSVVVKSVSINRVTFRRIAPAPNEIDFKFTYLNKPARGRNLEIQGAFGVLINETDFVKTVQVYEFPCRGTVMFQAETTRDAQGGATGDYLDGNLEFKINQPGKWEISLDMRQ
jgi:hypothetical protein